MPSLRIKKIEVFYHSVGASMDAVGPIWSQKQKKRRAFVGNCNSKELKFLFLKEVFLWHKC